MANLILVDDHALFRLGVRTAIELSGEDFRIIGEAASARELWALLERQLPDLLLLDVILPDMHGGEIVKILRERYPQVRVLILSAETNEDTILQLVQTGIDGFISKEIVNTGLVTAIRAILNGDQYFGSDIATILNQLIFESKRRPPSAGDVVFTDREMEIINLCCEGLPTKNISAQLNISPRTVEAHKANIFLKLGVTNLVELVRYCFKNGIVKL